MPPPQNIMPMRGPGFDSKEEVNQPKANGSEEDREADNQENENATKDNQDYQSSNYFL